MGDAAVDAVSETDLHLWTVAAAVIETDDGVLMVRNRRRGGRHDWTPPGGVVESSEEILDALAREVREETGLIVGSWGPLLYEVEAVAPDLGWHLRALIFRAGETSGELRVGDDPDGIVVDAAWVLPDACEATLAEAHDWVREPFLEWLRERFDGGRTYRYHLEIREGTASVSRR